MHVNLGEFRFVSAERGAEVLSLLVSRSAGSGFVQVTRVGPKALPAPDLASVGRPETALPPEAAEAPPRRAAEAPRRPCRSPLPMT